MSAERTETVWLDARCEVSLAELAQLSGFSEAELRELVEYGALVPNNPREAQWTFSGECVAAVRTAYRLRESFDLDPNALSLALGFLERIRAVSVNIRRSPSRFRPGTPEKYFYDYKRIQFLTVVCEFSGYHRCQFLRRRSR